MDLEKLVRDTKINAYLYWVLTGLILAVFIESFLDKDLLWIVMTGLTLIILTMPIRIHRNWKTTLPWELTFLATIPILVRAMEFSVFANQIATYLSIAALALIIAVELHIYTEVKFNHTFAILFTVAATLAFGGFWSIIQYNLDLHLGTSFLTTNEALMYEYLNIAAAGILAGVLFDVYFRRRDKIFRRQIKRIVSRK